MNQSILAMTIPMAVTFGPTTVIKIVSAFIWFHSCISSIDLFTQSLFKYEIMIGKLFTHSIEDMKIYFNHKNWMNGKHFNDMKFSSKSVKPNE